MKKSYKTLVQFARAAEALPFLKLLGIKKFQERVDPQLPGMIARGLFNSREIVVIHTEGNECDVQEIVAPYMVAVTTYAAMVLEEPDDVITGGVTSGVSQFEAAIGDVYMRCFAPPSRDNFSTLCGVSRNAQGEIKVAEISEMLMKLREIKKPTPASSESRESLGYTPTIECNEAVITDPEIAAIWWVVARFRRGMTALRAVSNLVDLPAPDAKQAAQNYDAAVSALSIRMKQVL